MRNAGESGSEGKGAVAGSTLFPDPTGSTIAPPNAPEGLQPTLESGLGLDRAEDYPEAVTVEPRHYAVGDVLAKGGMGRILVARDRRLGRQVALKELIRSTPALRTRFEREARITASLQHPSIVGVHEAGVWPSGEPFIAMDLVGGKSFDQVIASTSGLEQRLGLLPNVIAVADALAYSHSRHIIHRDLKPQNILVGQFGETIVIDWGLAKNLQDGSANDVAVGPYRESIQSDKTIAGSVLGTPAYMPPEQARGEPVDERADVYAIGAILYHVLGGGPPYGGGSSEEVLRQVEAGPPPVVEAQVAGIPGELLTIVGKAMARRPEERYPSARELADDLRRFQTGQLVGAHRYSLGQLLRRWVRRYRAAIAVAGVAVLVATVLGALAIRRIVDERERADSQRAQAERHRADAEGLMDFMLFELRDKLEPLGKLELLGSVATKAIDYYAERYGQLTEADRRRQAKALTSISQVLQAQGKSEAALKAARSAQAIAEPFNRREPPDATWLRTGMVIENTLGDILRAQGKPVDALAEYQHGKLKAERLVALAPQDVSATADLATSHTRIGDIHARLGKHADALPEYRRGLELTGRVAELEPQNPKWKRQRSVGHNKLGLVLGALGEKEAALAEYRSGMAIAQELYDADPKDAQRQFDLAISHNKVGDALLAQPDLPGALVEYRAALAVIEVLAARDKDNVVNQTLLSQSHQKVARVLKKEGQLAAAADELRASLAIAGPIAARDQENRDWQVELAIINEELGVVTLGQGDRKGALAAFKEALNIGIKLLQRDPKNPEWGKFVAEMTGRVLDCCASGP